MKKLFLFFIALLLWTGSSWGQILYEGFEGESPIPPADWSVYYSNPNPPEGNLVTHTADPKYAGSRSFRFSSCSLGPPYDQYLITPQLNVTSGDQTISFYYRNLATSETFRVGWSSEGNAIGNFTWTDDITNASTTWQQYLKNDLPEETKYIAIHYKSSYEYYLYVDEVVGPALYVSNDPPNCAIDPSPISNGKDVSISSKLNWASGGGTPTGYNLYFGTDGSGTATPTNLVNGTLQIPPYTHVSALKYNTTYYWQVVPFDAFGNATACPIWSFTTETGAPVLQYATGGIGKINLGWNGNRTAFNDKSARYPTSNMEMNSERSHGPAVRIPISSGRAVGDDCANPIVISELPYTDANTTCGRGNTYQETCLASYDGGEDIVYQLLIPESMTVEIDLATNDQWTGMLITTECPIGMNCVSLVSNSAGPKNMVVDLEAGTYYIMLDTWPTPNCFDFTLTVKELVPCKLTMPVGAINEGEPCLVNDSEDITNGGCNNAEPAFTPINDGDVIWGSSSTYIRGTSKSRDTDWYELVITEPKTVTFTATAEFPVIAGFIDQTIPGVPGCGNMTGILNPYDVANPCETASFTKTLIPGTYYFFVGLSVFEGYPCGTSNAYIVELNCEDVFVPYYNVIRDGETIATTYNTTYTDRNVLPDVQYCYTISTVLEAGVVSPPSNQCCATMLCGSGCDYTMVLTDSYGDGWNGASLTIRQGGIEIGTYTLGSGLTNTIRVELCDATETSFIWDSGEYDDENGFQLFNTQGDLLYSFGPYGSPVNGNQFFTFTTACPSLSTFIGLGNWSEADKWNNGIPEGYIDAIINGEVTVDGAFACSDLTINPSGAVTVAAGKSLSIGGNLFIKSDASGTGSFIDFGTFNIAGTNTIKRYLTGGWIPTNNGWHQISSPVVEQPISVFGTDGTTGNRYDFFGWRESDNLWLNYKGGDFNGWNGGANFNVGQGYQISYEVANITQTFTGTLNKGDVTKVGLSSNGGSYDGWNLLGNPFASALAWNDGNWTLGDIVGGVAKIWNENGKSYTDVGENGGIIPTAQGFMVQVTSETSLVIPAASRVHSSIPYYKSDNEQLLLVAAENVGGSAQESKILVNPMATEVFDFKYDSRFLAGYAPEFYSVIGDELLSTNSIPSIEAGLLIPFGFVKNAASDFTITLKESLPGRFVYLTDNKAGKVTNLTQNPIYSFTSLQGDDANRFAVTFGTLGINNPDDVEAIQVYAHGDVLYLATSSTEAALVNVYNLTGQLVMQGKTNGSDLTTFNASALSNGVYVVNVIFNQGVVSQKVVIRK